MTNVLHLTLYFMLVFLRVFLSIHLPTQALNTLSNHYQHASVENSFGLKKPDYVGELVSHIGRIILLCHVLKCSGQSL